LGQLGGDPGRPEAGMAEGEGDHPLLNQHAGLVGHARWATLAGPQDLGAMPIQLPLPAVEGGGMDPHGPTRRPHIAELSGHRKDP
jgi:hypothetical protein